MGAWLTARTDIPVRTRGRGTSLCHLRHAPMTRRPRAAARSWLRSSKPAAVVRGAWRREFPMKRPSTCLAVERSHDPEAPRRRGGPGVSRQRTGMSALARRHRDVPSCRPRYPWPAAAQPGADCSCSCCLRMGFCGLPSTPTANRPARSDEHTLQPRPRRVPRPSPRKPPSPSAPLLPAARPQVRRTPLRNDQRIGTRPAPKAVSMRVKIDFGPRLTSGKSPTGR